MKLISVLLVLTDQQTDRQKDRRTDRQTEMTTYRAAIAAKNTDIIESYNPDSFPYENDLHQEFLDLFIYL